MITDTARISTLQYIKDDIKEFKLGNVGTPNPESASDTGMTPTSGGSTIFTKALTSADIVINGPAQTLTINCAIEAGEANGGTWREVGVILNDGTLLSREIITSPVTKDASKRVVYSVVVTLF